MDRVYLIKNEEITQTDAYGKAVKRHSYTADTPYILTSKAQTKCHTHLTPAKPTPSAIDSGNDTGEISDSGADG